MVRPEHSAAFCPFYHQAAELIGRRWTGAILRALRADVHRFSDLKACIPDLSDRMLSERLKELEKEGLVERTVIPETPVRIDYHLTEKGRSLGGVMDALAEWAHTWVAPQGVPAEEPPGAPRGGVGRADDCWHGDGCLSGDSAPADDQAVQQGAHP